MQHSRKLVFPAATEAIRTSASLRSAAVKLGVNVSTLSRAIKAGKLAGPRRPGVRSEAAPVCAPGPGQTFEAWALATFDLTRAEQELVTLAQRALDLAGDATQPAAIRLTATAQFRATLKDLKLPTEAEFYGDVETPVRFPRPVAH